MRLSASARLQQLLLGGLILTQGLPQTAEAMQPFGPTDSEMLLLPTYCQGGLSPEKFPQYERHWKAVAGSGMNHYCYALNFINRANQARIGGDERKHYIAEAADNLEYVMKRNNDKHILAPDFHISLANVLVLQGRTTDAASHFLKATVIRPDYPKGWLALSDLYKGMGQFDQARETLEKGLKASPEKYKDYMRKRLAELDAEAKTNEQQTGK